MLIICGIDEAGRGALAGPVCAAAVVLGEHAGIDGLADSKTLTERSRHRLAEEIKLRSLAWGVGWSLVEDIDRFNILRATLLAMRRAYEAAVTMLAIAAEGVSIDEVLIDGDTAPELPVRTRTIVRGDATIPSISAASILAKVERDAQMHDSCGEPMGDHVPADRLDGVRGDRIRRTRPAVELALEPHVPRAAHADVVLQHAILWRQPLLAPDLGADELKQVNRGHLLPSSSGTSTMTVSGQYGKTTGRALSLFVYVLIESRKTTASISYAWPPKRSALLKTRLQRLF